MFLVNVALATSSRAKHVPTTHAIELNASETNLIVNINDSVNFKCPTGDQLKVYMVSKLQYSNCAIEEDDKLILECTNAVNAEPEDTEFKITSFSPQVDAFLFAPNQQYFYVARLNEGGCHSKVVMSVSRRKGAHHRQIQPKKTTSTKSSTTSTTTSTTSSERPQVFSAVKSPSSSSSLPSLSLSLILIMTSLLFG